MAFVLKRAQNNFKFSQVILLLIQLLDIINYIFKNKPTKFIILYFNLKIWRSNYPQPIYHNTSLQLKIALYNNSHHRTFTKLKQINSSKILINLILGRKIVLKLTRHYKIVSLQNVQMRSH